jgi:hypothetical protein
VLPGQGCHLSQQSAIDECMEQWWTDDYQGKANTNSEKDLLHCYSVHNKPHMKSYETEAIALQ